MVTPETGLILDDDRPDLACLHISLHLNIRGAGVVGAAVAVVYVELAVVKTKLFSVLAEYDFLIGYEFDSPANRSSCESLQYSAVIKLLLYSVAYISSFLSERNIALSHRIGYKCTIP